MTNLSRWSEYLVWRQGDGPDPIGDANRNGCFQLAIRPEFGLSHFLEETEESGGFADSYPRGETYCVLDIETGDVYRFRVETEYDPVFVYEEL